MFVKRFVVRIFPKYRGDSIQHLPFVFLIGFNKTATRAFHHFFLTNGFPSVHWDQGRLVKTMVANMDRGTKVFDGYDQRFRVFSDFFWRSDDGIIEGSQFFRRMDQDYPGAYFVLNNRNTSDWIRSRMLHSQGDLVKTQLRLLGSNDERDAIRLWTEQKTQFETEVRNYFDERKRFIEIDISEDRIPQKLERFLGFRFHKVHWKLVGKS